jgi:inorganic triphosphatase YgiF
VASRLDGKALRAGIKPIFETVVDRSQWHFNDGGDEVEVVLDRGEVVVEAGSAPIHEVELELIQGSPARIFDFARELNGSVPLRIGVLTKSERGYRLLDGDQRASVKAERVAFSTERSAGDGFQTIAMGCIRHFRLNESLFTRDRSGAALHQARVAFRRLRSAMSLFAPAIGDEELAPLREELRWISGPLGSARDLDVFFQKRIAPAAVSPELWSQLLRQREEAFDGAIEALESERFRRLMITLVQWTATGPWLNAGGELAAWREQPLHDFAVSALDRLWRKLKKRGRHLARLDDEERHRARIAGKKLRYGSEFFASLFSDKKSRARHAAFVAALEHLQEELGDLNDIVAARALVDRIGAKLGSEASRDELIRLANRAPDAEKQKHLAAGGAAYQALFKEGPFWR